MAHPADFKNRRLASGRLRTPTLSLGSHEDSRLVLILVGFKERREGVALLLEPAEHPSGMLQRAGPLDRGSSK
jgi:hypothetical protein